MSVVVRCPSCLQLSRVGVEAVGLTVACPRCQHQFTAVPHAVSSPPVKPRNPVFVPRPAPTPPPHPWDDDAPVVHPHAGGSAPFAIALFPLGIPLLWLMIALLARKSVFSFAAPVAIAVSVCLLGFGLAGVRHWSAAVRTRALIALVALAYLSAGVLYFAQPSWLEGVRTLINRSGQDWKEYRPDDRTFKVRVPGTPTPTDPPVPNWNLTAVRVADPKNPIDVFTVAHGEPPNTVPAREVDAVWFERVKATLLTTAGAELVREQPAVVGEARAIARDYELRLRGDDTAKRVVRVVRAGGRMYYLSVDSPWVTLDALDVQQFWNSFRLTPGKKK